MQKLAVFGIDFAANQHPDLVGAHEVTIFLTIFSGVFVFVIGQLLMKFVIDPVHSQRETIGEVVDFLILHANVYTSPGMRHEAGLVDQEAERARRAQLTETKETARALASKLMVRTQAIPLYGTLERLGWTVKRSGIRRAQKSLFFISNAMFDVGHAMDNYNHARLIEDALGVRTEFQIEEADRPQQEQEDDNERDE